MKNNYTRCKISTIPICSRTTNETLVCNNVKEEYMQVTIPEISYAHQCGNGFWKNATVVCGLRCCHGGCNEQTLACELVFVCLLLNGNYFRFQVWFQKCSTLDDK